jgi:hypothetical protein
MCMHRDRRSDEVRAAKCTGADCPRQSAAMRGAHGDLLHGPPLCGRPGKATAGVDSLGRATGPSCGSLLLSRLPRPITAAFGHESGPLDLVSSFGTTT